MASVGFGLMLQYIALLRRREMADQYGGYVEDVIAIAKKAAQAIMQIYTREGEVKYKLKADDSPLTEADLLANEIIQQELAVLTPNIPVLSEEAAEAPFAERQQWSEYWLVDPLDGTKEFLERTGQFTVNIALIVKQQPVLGIVYMPVSDACYYAWRDGGAFLQEASGERQRLHTKTVTDRPVKIIVSKVLGADNLQPFLAKLPEYELHYYGGSLKLCMVATGEFDFYPRLSANCEWDTAAGQCIVEEAGGAVVDLEFRPLRYNTKESFYNPPFLVFGDPAYWQEHLR